MAERLSDIPSSEPISWTSYVRGVMEKKERIGGQRVTIYASCGRHFTGDVTNAGQVSLHLSDPLGGTYVIDYNRVEAFSDG